MAKGKYRSHYNFTVFVLLLKPLTDLNPQTLLTTLGSPAKGNVLRFLLAARRQINTETLDVFYLFCKDGKIKKGIAIKGMRQGEKELYGMITADGNWCWGNKFGEHYEVGPEGLVEFVGCKTCGRFKLGL